MADPQHAEKLRKVAAVTESGTLRAALEAGAAALAETKWRPIETSPESTVVIAWLPSYGWCRAIKTTIHGLPYWWSGEEVVYPTLWQPAPVAPDTAKEPTP